ncbi:MAG TPA: hypothetical protein VIT89_07495 [Solirubrobacterales bacterium]
MKKTLLVLAMTSLAVLASAPAATAFEGGGRKPSEAPLIEVGRHYTGQLTNRKDDANYGGFVQVAIWRLPPLSARDVLYVNWHSLPKTGSPGYFPVCMMFAQGIDDYTWGTRFSQSGGNVCEGSSFTLSGSGTARTAITVPETNASSSYLEFFTLAEQTTPAKFESFPYDFTIDPPLHYLGLAVRDKKKVKANGIVQATALQANGLPAPDGLAFNLTVTWAGSGSATYSGVSSAGVVTFQLALPETAYDERGTFVVSHPADGVYVGATARLRMNIKEPGLTPCARAEIQELSLRRQYKRLSRRAKQAHTAPRRAAFHRRAAKVKRRLRAAHLKTDSLCSP